LASVQPESSCLIVMSGLHSRRVRRRQKAN
jgi:hypothetical protein